MFHSRRKELRKSHPYSLILRSGEANAELNMSQPTIPRHCHCISALYVISMLSIGRENRTQIYEVEDIFQHRAPLLIMAGRSTCCNSSFFSFVCKSVPEVLDPVWFVISS